MLRATSVIFASQRGNRAASDAVILDYRQRSAATGTVTSVNGVMINIALRGQVRLATDDLLLLDDGALVEVVAAPEQLLEVRAADVAVLARIAWHLGDRHIQVELLPNRIRTRCDPAIEALLTSFGARVTVIKAPFQPEGGAYAALPVHGHDRHDHPHDHTHDHSNDHAHGHVHD